MKKILIISLIILNCPTAFSQKKQDKIYFYNDFKEIIKEIDNEKLIIKCAKFIKKYQLHYPQNDSITAKAYHVLGRTFWYNKELDFGIACTKHSININAQKDQGSNRADMAGSFFNLASIYSEKNDYVRAIDNFKRAALISEEFQHKKKLIPHIHSSLANIYFLLGDYQKCIEQGSLGFKKAIQINDFVIANSSLIEKSQGEIAMNQPAKAYETISLALKYSGKTDDKKLEAYNYMSLANIAKIENKHLDYVKNLDKALKIFSKKYDGELLDKYGTALVLDYLGLYYTSQNQYQLAEKHFEKALFYTDAAIDSARIIGNLAVSYKLEGKFEKALNYFNQSFNVAPINFKNFNITINPDPLKLKNYSAKEYFLPLIEDKANCWLSYYKKDKKLEYLKAAAETYFLADKMIDFMRHEHQGTQSKYFWRNNTRPIYEAAIEASFLLKDYNKAFYFFEKSRSAMLNDKLNELGAKQKLSENDQQYEREFQRKIVEKTIKIEAEKNGIAKEKWIAELAEIQEKSNQFKKTLEIKNPAYFQLKYDTTVASLDQIQKYLKNNFKEKNATFLQYFMGYSAQYAMVITAQKAEIKKLNFDANLSNQFMKLVSANIKTKTALSAFNAISKQLYRQLISTLNINDGHLIISQDGSLLPFEALINGQTNKFMLENYAISYTYSAQFLLKNQQDNSFLPYYQFIGFAPVNFAKNLGSLIGSKKSVEALGTNFFFNSKYIEKKATKRNFLDYANKYQIVHLYTHALADSNENEPRIYFADSSLKVSELSAVNRFNTSLIVLSACNTGVGKLAKGEGVLSLARGFSMLGIPSTITSLWSVQDVDTYAVTELFYKYLNKGMPKNEALQKAKLEFLSLNPNASSSQWAGLVLVGDTKPIKNQNSIYGLIIGLLVALSFGFLFLKKRKVINRLPNANAE